MSRLTKDILLTLRGIGIGAANVIPGVSGGTIAFLTGIYEELIESIKSFNIKNLKLLFSGKFKEFAKATDLEFLTCILFGVLVSAFSLAKLMVYLLNEQAIPTWAFFFGLIVVSCVYIFKEIKKWDMGTIISLLVGAAIAVYICFASPAQTTDSWWFIIICGAIAICSMILPGISGSFVLLLLVKYEYVMEALSSFNLPVLLLFAIGAVAGIIAFSHLLSWLLKKYYQQTISLLCGFMVGSLVRVWPWQQEIVNIVNGSNIATSRPVMPDGQIGTAIVFALIGILLVVILEVAAKKAKTNQDKTEFQNNK